MDVFTDDDLKQADRMETLGPAYFASRRMAEALMAGTEAEPLTVVAKKCTDLIRDAVYDYVEGWMLGDLESNIQLHITYQVEATVRALLTGEEWALKQYPLSQYHDGDKIRAAVAKHCGDRVLAARVADLEKEVERLKSDLAFYRDRRY